MYDSNKHEELEQICKDIKKVSCSIRNLNLTSQSQSDCIELSSQLDKISNRLNNLILSTEDDGK